MKTEVKDCQAALFEGSESENGDLDDEILKEIMAEEAERKKQEDEEVKKNKKSKNKKKKGKKGKKDEL